MNRKGHRKGAHRKLSKDSPYAGLTTCLRCDAAFQSWDRRQNRLCERCRESIEAQPSEEPSYRVGKRQFRREDEA